MNYQESIDWLYGTQLFGIKLGLENTEKLLNAFVTPVAKTRGIGRVVHVAGTNGKGSVCAFCDRILRDGGLRVGLFTSPHLVSFRERIQVDGAWIPESEVAEGLAIIRSEVESWETHPTFFEITLTLAMRHFVQSGCEAIILETGMGGRLDATNAIRSDVSVITPIGLDHQQWLGDTIREIAAEKAGILKPDAPVIIADLHPDARDVVGRKALALGIPCVEAHPLPEDWTPGLPGPHQRENAALAVEAACRIEGDRLTRDGIRDSVAATRWPGRFEIVRERFVLDGAHNPEAAGSLRRTWTTTFPEDRAHLVFGAADSKDASAILRELREIVAAVSFVPIRSERRLSRDRLIAAWESAGGEPGQVRPPAELPDLLQSGPEGSERMLVAGSLFLVGEARAHLLDEEFETSLQ